MAKKEKVSIVQQWTKELDLQYEKEQDTIKRKSINQRRREFEQFIKFSNELELDTSLEEALSDERGYIFRWYLIHVLKNHGKTKTFRACYYLRQAIAFWYKNKLGKYHPDFLSSPKDPPDYVPCALSDAWFVELNRRVWLAEDDEGNPIPKSERDPETLEFSTALKMRSSFEAYLKYALANLGLRCILGDWSDEIVWVDAPLSELEPADYFLNMLAEEKATVLLRHLNWVCLNYSKSTSDSIASDLRAATDFLHKSGLINFPASVVTTPVLNPEIPSLSITSIWFDEIEHRKELPKRNPDKISVEYAQNVKRVFKQFLKFSVEKLKISLKLEETGIVASWKKGAKSSGDPIEVLLMSIFEEARKLQNEFLIEEGKRVTEATLKTTSTCLVKAFDFLDKLDPELLGLRTAKAETFKKKKKTNS